MNTLDYKKLNPKDKLKLIADIHNSMDNIELSDAIKSILDKRLQRIENNEVKYFTLNQLKDRIKDLK